MSENAHVNLLVNHFNMKKEHLEHRIKTLVRLYNVARDILSKTSIPIFFDLDEKSGMITRAHSDEKLRKHLEEVLELNFVEGPQYYIAVYKDTIITLGR